MPLPDTYADVSQLQTYWRTLSATEQVRATDLLTRAATLINEQPGAADANGDPAFSLLAAEQVSMDMVKRAMVGGAGDGVQTASQAMADMNANITYANPMGNLYLTRQERDRLAGYAGGGMFSLTPTSNVRVPLAPWTYQESSQTDGSV